MIHLETVSRIFPVGGEQVHALARVSLQVDKGEYLSIMGPSGSGKSTLLNILGLLDRPDEGRYRIDGQDTTDLSDNRQARLRRYRIGFIFQFFHLVPRLTAADNVALPLVLAGIPVRERRSRVEAALTRFGIANRAGHRPDQLSGGQRQRVAIARAVIMNPAIILADEPTGNLDRASGGEIIQAIESLRGEGMTVLIVTHDPQIGDRADRCIRMVDGRIVADDRRKG
ncbi:ABC transporter ATP-binding protein [Desulfosarcina ovata]|uniref:Macrolide ABC transporter ATP-binding protein n=1 Tax=Desulfosarcina ovata subsp. ovata TaxID=2752305 RepID=A0A5K8A5T2_9BACT|nr:ABC transporter ATP-binding protein [Desulfosarcina ovata]BBO87942.1 macrolide ABC transporter ATP-binding protein [Desulfosarcina ovata subsp. ovata]